jgi:hypothetical protein
MTLIKEASEHLTHSPFDDRARRTFPGMASWGGEGLPFSTCRHCQSWGPARYDANGYLKRAPCAKYREMTRQDGKLVPHNAERCKFFVEAKNIPPPFNRPR